MALGLGNVFGMRQSGNLSAARFAPYPAPSGYHWEFVTTNGQRVTSNGVPVVSLVGN